MYYQTNTNDSKTQSDLFSVVKISIILGRHIFAYSLPRYNEFKYFKMREVYRYETDITFSLKNNRPVKLFTQNTLHKNITMK